MRSHLGLVETRNGAGTIVIALSDDEIRQVYEMRLHLATLIGTITPKPIDQSHKAQARELPDQARQLAGDFASRKYVALNHELNDLIAGMSGNTVLRSFWRQTYYQAASTWHRVATIVGSAIAKSLVDELADLNLALDKDDLEAVGYVQRIYIG